MNTVSKEELGYEVSISMMIMMMMTMMMLMVMTMKMMMMMMVCKLCGSLVRHAQSGAALHCFFDIILSSSSLGIAFDDP